MTDRTDELADLLRHTARMQRRRTAAIVEPHGLSVHQFRAMRLIAGRSGQAGRDGHGGSDGAGGAPLRISDIAERMRMVTRSATDVVDHLQTKGLVQRSAHPTDRRSTVVQLTSQGERLLATLEVERAAHTEEFFSQLTDAEQTELARLLHRLQE